MAVDVTTRYGSVINDKGRKLAYRYAYPVDAQLGHDLVIMGHGYGGDKDRPYIQKVAQVSHTMGMATLSFDLTGCGQSEGKLGDLTPKIARNDWKTMVEFSNTLPGVNPKRRAAFGTSFSANALMEYAASEKADELQALVLHAPVPKPRDIVNIIVDLKLFMKRKKLAQLGLDEVVQIKLPGLDLHVSQQFREQMREMNLCKTAAPHITPPVTIIAGDKDELASLKELKKLRDAFPKKSRVHLEIIPGATHDFKDNQLDHMAKIAGNAFVTAFDPGLTLQVA